MCGNIVVILKKSIILKFLMLQFIGYKKWKMYTIFFLPENH